MEITDDKSFQAALRVLGRPVFYETGGGIEFVSENIFDLTGYSPDQFNLNRDFFPGHMHPQDYIEVNHTLVMWHKQNEQEPVVTMFRFNVENRGYIWLEDHIVSVTENGKKYMRGLMIDIDQERKDENSLYEEKFRFDQHHAGIPIKDRLPLILEQLEQINEIRRQRRLLVLSVFDYMQKNGFAFRDL